MPVLPPSARPASRLALALTCLLAAQLGRAAASAGSMTEPLLYAPPACAGNVFSDVGALHPYCSWIEQLRNDGIATSCAAGRYCPDAPVTRGQLAMLLERAMRGTATWDPWRGVYRRTVVASPVLVGNPGTPDPVQSGQLLLALMAAIPDASEANPYLLKIEPGLYDLGTAFLDPKAWVDVEGSGEQVTVLTGSGARTVMMSAAGQIEMRALTVRATGAAHSTAIFIELGPVSLRQLTVLVDPNGNFSATGINSEFTADVRMHDVQVRAVATGSANATGIQLEHASNLEAVEVEAEGGNKAVGISFRGFGVVHRVRNVVARAHDADTSNFALEAQPDSTIDIELAGSRAEASNGSVGNRAVGLYVNGGADVVAHAVELGTYESSTGTRNAVGCSDNEGPATIQITGARLYSATTAGNATIDADGDCTVNVATSLLDGAVVSASNGAVIDCAQVVSELWNGNFDDTCP